MKQRSIEKVLSTFNAWFEEVTPRFQLFSLLVGTISAILTTILFLQPVFASVKTMPVQVNAQGEHPNIILIIADALSANDMSMFGSVLPTTPNLERITRDWTVFSNAQSPLTCTAAALPTLISGRYTNTNNFPYYGEQMASRPGWMSISNALEQNDYQTWWSGFHTPGFYHMGQDFQRNVCGSQGSLFVKLSRSWFKPRAISMSGFPFVPFSLYLSGYLQSWNTDFGECANLSSLEDLLQSGSLSEPFFIYYHYQGAHGFPYPSEDALGTFLPESEGLITEQEQRVVYGFYKPEQQPIVDELHLRYAEAILDQDRALATLIESLKSQGSYDSTMIIITSDHGQSFANSYTTHCTPLVSYVETHVPLLIKYPYQTKGKKFDFLVSTIDIAPTILDVAGMEYPQNWFDGISLLKQAEQPESNRIVFSRRYNYYYKSVPSEIAVIGGRYRLVMRVNQMFLFDIQNDPLEKVNLLEQTGYKGDLEVQRLQQALALYRQRAQYLLDGGNILSARPMLMIAGSQPGE